MSQIPPDFPRPGGQSPDLSGPAWHPDPTGRHQHRYWDGARWTDHVADGAVESVDPFAGGSLPAAPFAQRPYIGGTPMPQATHAPGGRPPRSGPAPGLLIAVGVLAIALIVGLGVALTRDDESTTTSTTTDDTTTSDDAATSDDTTTSDDTNQSAIVDELAAGISQSAGGAITDDQANCIAEGYLDAFGLDRLIEIGQDSGVDPFANLTSDEQAAAVSATMQCVDAETLAEIGADPDG